MPPCPPPPRVNSVYDARGFTLIEILSTITIIAVLTTMVVFFTASYVQWAKQTADRQTLTILNDALTRYKCEGGNINALTAGAPVGHILSALTTAITWAGTSHQVMPVGRTYSSSLLSGGGAGSNYVFYQYNSYNGYADGSVSPPSTMPYGQGVGYMANGGAADYYLLYFKTSTGYWAYKDDAGNTVGPIAQVTAYTIPRGPRYVTFWSCSSNSTAINGSFYRIKPNGISLSNLNVTGLTSLSEIDCEGNFLTSLDLSQNIALTSLCCGYNRLTMLDLSNNLNLQTIYCDSTGQQNISMLNITGLTHINNLSCFGNLLTSLDLSHNPSLSFLRCTSNMLGPIYLGGNTPATFFYTPQKTGYTPSLQ